MPSAIIPAIPCELVSLPNLLVSLQERQTIKPATKKQKTTGKEEDQSHAVSLLPDIRVYQAGEDPQQGLNFALRDATIVMPVERKTPSKIYVTFAFAFDSNAYQFLKALNTRVKELIRKARNWESGNEESEEEHITDLFDEDQGTLRVLMNRHSRYSHVSVPCQKEGNPEERRQIFQLSSSDRLLISINLQHIWGVLNGATGNHQKKGIHSAFMVLKSIVVLHEGAHCRGAK